MATRLAIRTRTAVSRRRAREVPLVNPPASEPAPQAGDDLWPLLCEEIGRLPDKYRIPFVLCYLEGKTNEEAATQMRCATGTVFSRLARARERLRQRLGRRGLAVSSGLLAATLVALPREAVAAVSPQLLRATVRGAVSFATPTGRDTADASDRAVTLARQQLAASNHRATKVLVAGVLASALVGLVAGPAVRRAADRFNAAGPTNANGGAVALPVADDKSVDDRLQGIWVLQSMVMNGEAIVVPPGAIRISFGPNGTFNATDSYSIDTRPRPMQLVQRVDGHPLPGIFDLQRDALTVCYALGPDSEIVSPVPTTFAPGPGRAYMVYSRQRP